MNKRLTVMTLALLVSGCGGQNQAQYQAQAQNQAQAPTNAQRQMETIKGVMAAAGSIGVACFNEVNSHPDSVAAKELLPLDDPSKASITQLASTARPTRSQIAKIVAFKQGRDKCVEQMAVKVREIDQRFSNILLKTDRDQDVVIVNLMHGKLNLGEAILALQAAIQRSNQEGNALAQKIEADLHRQSDMEIAQRQAAYAQQQIAQAQAQAQGEADMAAFGNSMQAASAQFNQQVQQRAQAAVSFQPTPVMPLTRPGGDQVRCLQVGILTNCRSY
jgi:hypothetical protein